jgi:hypothetical protein
MEITECREARDPDLDGSGCDFEVMHDLTVADVQAGIAEAERLGPVPIPSCAGQTMADARTAAEWANEKNCGKDCILRWLKRGIAAKQVQVVLGVQREDITFRPISVPGYRVSPEYARTNPRRR